LKEFTVNWDFVVLVGTMMFFALLHVFSPDGRQWRDDIATTPVETDDVPPVLDHDIARAPAPAATRRARR
jgi:hypothetical protein